MTNYVCIHSHLYQPPRENPWLERIEIQDSAYPYHDWNMRINAECYGPNAASRILDDQGRITRIVNNYEKISFNFGPTLLGWLQKSEPDTYRKIIEADSASIKTRSGHGNAIAQAYNHMIMPLANRRDKVTQVYWGIKAFRHHFNRDPAGMWLPETAVDLETLEILADQGIQYTILAPSQARRIRMLEEKGWENVVNGEIDTRRPYLLRLPCGGSIALFFYNGQIAHEVAFGELLASGEILGKRFLQDVQEKTDTSTLIHIATDGETFGHHHRFGDMALAYAVDLLEKNESITLTNYGEYLSLHPPQHEVQLHENSSWSCVHGIERWRSDCGCSSGYQGTWNQAWRVPLRESLDWLRFKLIAMYRKQAANLFSDPWLARDHYIAIVLDRSGENKKRFLQAHCKKGISREEQIMVWTLLEMQRNAMLMYTSCGWFFDEISGIEPVQILTFAARAIDLANSLSGNEHLETVFLDQLSEATSNIEGMGNGSDIYKKFVSPAKVSLQKAAAHTAINSFFANDQKSTQLGCFTMELQESIRLADKHTAVAVGRLDVTNTITGSSAAFVYAAVQQELHDFTCAVQKYSELAHHFSTSALGQVTDVHGKLAVEIGESFRTSGIAGALKIMDNYFDSSRFTLKDIFKDEQQQQLTIIIQEGLDTIEKTFEQAYKSTSFLMGLLESLGHRVPVTFSTAAEIALKREIVKIFEGDTIKVEQMDFLLKELKRWDITLDSEWVGNVVEARVAREAKLLQQSACLATLQRMNSFLSVLSLFPEKANFWQLQNIYYEIMASTYMVASKKRKQHDKEAKNWLDEFHQLGHKLFMNVEELAKNLEKDVVTTDSDIQTGRDITPCVDTVSKSHA